MMQTIYVDELFVTNLVMNFIILWATAKLGRIDRSTGRLLFGASVGALYSFAVFLPQLSILVSTFAKLIFAGIIVCITFAPIRLRKFLRILICFYLVSFGLGGAAFGIIYLTNGEASFVNGAVYYTGSNLWKGLFTAVAVGIILGRFMKNYLAKIQWQQMFRFPLNVYIDGQKIEVAALLDTGNLLREPVSGFPVLIVEQAVLLPYLPPALQTAAQSGEDGTWLELTEIAADPAWVSRFCVIPYRSLGKRNGLLIGLRPDKIEICDQAKVYSIEHVIIGITRQPLCSEGDYHALLHPEIIQSVVS